MKKNTYTRAYEACEQLFLESGAMPTIDAIKPMIGVNSPATISAAIKDWKAALSTTMRKEQGGIADIPAQVSEAAWALWQLAMEEALKTQNEQRQLLEAQQQQLQAKEVELSTEAARVAEQIQLLTAKHHDEVGFLNQEISRLKAELQAAKQLVESNQAQVMTVEKHNAALIEEIRQEQAKLILLESRYNKEHEWALMRIETEKEALKKQWASEMSRLKTDVERYKQDLQRSESRFETAQQQLNSTTEKLDKITAKFDDEATMNRQLLSDKQAAFAQMKLKDKKIAVLLEKLTKLKRRKPPIDEKQA